MRNGGKGRKSCGQYPKSHLALSHRCLQRKSAQPAPMKLKLQQGRREALLVFSHIEAGGSAPKRGLGLFASGWEGWRRKGEHRSVIRALKDKQRKSLSKERSWMFYKVGLKKRYKTFAPSNSCVVFMAVASGLKVLPVSSVICEIQYCEQMKYCDGIYMNVSKVQKQNALLLIYNQNAVVYRKRFIAALNKQWI